VELVRAPSCGDGWAPAGVEGGLSGMADSSWRSRLQQSSSKSGIEAAPAVLGWPVSASWVGLADCLRAGRWCCFGEESEAVDSYDELCFEGVG
jgi:hypothetical protein